MPGAHRRRPTKCMHQQGPWVAGLHVDKVHMSCWRSTERRMSRRRAITRHASCWHALTELLACVDRVDRARMHWPGMHWPRIHWPSCWHAL